jgi:hypothetical protein
MDFEGYFDASEQAFVIEKEVMLDRIDKMKNSWTETVQIDLQCAKRSDELQQLKELLSKGHLQILRTREEILRVEVQNAVRSFRIRKLRREIARLLPYADKRGPSTDYRLGVVPSSIRPSKVVGVKSDERLEKSLIQSRAKWREILVTQAGVFAEELQHRTSDAEYFEKFDTDFRQQNSETHRSVDDLLDVLIRRTVEEKNTFGILADHQRETIGALTSREDQLSGRIENMKTVAAEKTTRARQKAQRMAVRETGRVRQRIKALEEQNQVHFHVLKGQSEEVRHRHETLLKEVTVLQDRQKTLVKRNERLTGEGMMRIAELEHKLHAIISAAAAIGEYTRPESNVMLKTVAAAVGPVHSVCEK